MGVPLGPRILERRYEPPAASSGEEQAHAAKVDAKLGSEALRGRLLVAFGNFGRRHRISDEEARVLLMDTGVRL